MKDLMKLFRQTGKTNLVTSMVEAIQIGLVTMKDVHEALNIPSISLMDDIAYFEKQVWKSFALPKQYLLNDPSPQPTECTNLKGRTVIDAGYFYAPYIPRIKDTYINDVKVDVRTLYDNVVEIDMYVKPATPVEFITLNFTVGESAADRYERAMKVVG